MLKMQVFEYFYSSIFDRVVGGQELNQCCLEMTELFLKYNLNTRIITEPIISEVGDYTFRLIKDNNDIMTDKFLLEFINQFCCFSDITLQGYLEMDK